MFNISFLNNLALDELVCIQNLEKQITEKLLEMKITIMKCLNHLVNHF